MILQNLRRPAMYAVLGAAGAIFQYSDVISEDPFGEILYMFLVLVVHLILCLGLTLMLMSVVFPQVIFPTTALKRLALMGLALIAAAVAIDIFLEDKKQGMCYGPFGSFECLDSLDYALFH